MCLGIFACGSVCTSNYFWGQVFWLLSLSPLKAFRVDQVDQKGLDSASELKCFLKRMVVRVAENEAESKDQKTDEKVQM